MRLKNLLILLCILIISCSSEEEQFNSILEGRRYVLTEFVIEIPVDGNNDGIYSTNLIDEDSYDCFGSNTLGFRNGKTGFILEYGGNFSVNDENQQFVACYIIDYFSEGPNYTMSEDETSVFIGNDELSIEGDTLTFLTSTQNFVSVGTILNEDGTITDYQGSIKMIFTRTE